MKRVDQQMKKTIDSEIKKLLSVLPLLELHDKRRLYILNQISLLKRIEKLDNPTKIEVSTATTQSPLQEFLKRHKNEEVTKKEKQRGKYSKV